MKKISELINLKGRFALVTGGAGHIGLAICESLMELGANVCILDIDEEMCRSRCNILNKGDYLGKAYPIPVDLSNEIQTRQAVENSACIMGGLDIIIHSAAFVGTTLYPGWAVSFEEQSVAAWDASMRVNLTSAFVIVQEGEKYLKKSKKSSVIFISSIYGIVGTDMRLYEGTNMATPAGYAASKGGLIQLSRYFATLFAPKIRFNVISAGGVWRNQHEVFHKRYVERTPMKRMATEEDFKGAIAFLASDLSAYVTGENLVIDGGWSVW